MQEREEPLVANIVDLENWKKDMEEVSRRVGICQMRRGNKVSEGLTCAKV